MLSVVLFLAGTCGGSWWQYVCSGSKHSAVAGKQSEAHTEAAGQRASVEACQNPLLAASQACLPAAGTATSAAQPCQGESKATLKKQGPSVSAFADATVEDHAAVDKWLAAKRVAVRDSAAGSDDRQQTIPATGPGDSFQEKQRISSVRHPGSSEMPENQRLDRHSPVGAPWASNRRHSFRGKPAGPSDWDHQNQMHSPFDMPQARRRSTTARAGPPPDKRSFRNSFDSWSSGEAFCTSSRLTVSNLKAS